MQHYAAKRKQPTKQRWTQLEIEAGTTDEAEQHQWQDDQAALDFGRQDKQQQTWAGRARSNRLGQTVQAGQTETEEVGVEQAETNEPTKDKAETGRLNAGGVTENGRAGLR